MVNSPAPAALSLDNRDGALWMLASVAGATGMSVAIRWLTPDLHTAMLAFLRSAFGLLLVLPVWAGMVRRGQPPRFSRGGLHLVRGLSIAVALNAGFYALWHLPLATATILFFTAPVFATLLAIPLAGEQVGPWRWSAIAAGFAGAVMILRPGLDALDPAMLAAIGSSVAFALALILGKLAARTDGNGAVFVSSSLVVALATLPPALAVWQMPGTLALWLALGLLVGASSLRQYADIRAYSAAEASFLAPFSYLRLLTVGLAGYALFGETIDLWTVAGGAVIVAATLVIALRGSGGATP